MPLPWWSRICAKLVLSRLPFGYSMWQRLGLFRHGRMDTSEYPIRVFGEHLRKSGFEGQLAGRTVLEVGPGDSVATAVIAAAHGARAILVDSGPYARADMVPYGALETALRAQGLNPPDLTGCRDVTEVLASCQARYYTRGLESLREIDTGCVDLIFSQAVLEHIRKHEFLAFMRESRRILAPGGRCSHQVDLRDHLGGALNNLRFSERTWESAFFTRSGFYTNRIGFTGMIELFREAGFEVTIGGVRRWPALPTPRGRLAREFQRVADEELCVSGFEVLLC
jgi:SAM-dependent methyltransferase